MKKVVKLPTTEVVKAIMKAQSIVVKTDYSLRTKRSVMREEPKKVHKKCVLLINKKGSICYAVYSSGALILLESPEYIHAARDNEHAVNFFLNNLQKLMNF